MKIIPKYNLITVLGPTASGKTSFATNLACRLNGEIISGDSRQVYKNMNIGTGKDYDDYFLNGVQVPYHLIDLVDPGYQYNLHEYQLDFVKVFNGIEARNKLPILCGGSGLYIEAVLNGYKLLNVPVNEELRLELQQKGIDELIKLFSSYERPHNHTDTRDKKRLVRAIEIAIYNKEHNLQLFDYPEIRPVIYGIQFDVETRRKRITERLHSRLKNGMIEEVVLLLKSGLTPEQLIYYGLEYKYITYYLTEKMSYNEMVEKLNIAIHQFAKRQMTWFRKMERSGTKINWIDGQIPMEEKVTIAIELYRNNS